MQLAFSFGLVSHLSASLRVGGLLRLEGDFVFVHVFFLFLGGFEGLRLAACLRGWLVDWLLHGLGIGDSGGVGPSRP